MRLLRFRLVRGAGVPLVVALAAALLLVPTPAQAATRRVVYISAPGVSSVWPLARAIGFMNRYTGSKLVWGPCQAAAPCVVVSESSNLGLRGATAITYPTSGSAGQGERAFRTAVVLGIHARKLSRQARYSTLVHELGHAFGLWRHSHRCSSVMYPSSRCRAVRFTAYERSILRRN